MTALARYGYDLGDIRAEGDGHAAGTGLSIVSTPLASAMGRGALKLASGNAGGGGTVAISGGATQRNYYWSAAFRYAAGVSSGTVYVATFNGGGIGYLVFAGADSKLYLHDTNFAVVATSTVLTADTYYDVEVRFRVGTTGFDGQMELQINGSSIGSSAVADCGTVVPSSWTPLTGSVDADCFVDDVKLNDDQGSAPHNTWPGNSRLAALLPVSDNARVGWQTGAGGTTGLFGDVDNLPPVGVATPAASPSQIKTNNNNTTDTYSADMGAYSDAVGSGGAGLTSETVLTVQSIMSHGQNVTTARDIAQQVTSNPAITETTSGGTGAAVGTWPTNWVTHRGTLTDVSGSQPTLGTKPVMRVRRAETGANFVYVSQMALIVEFDPLAAGAPANSMGMVV